MQIGSFAVVSIFCYYYYFKILFILEREREGARASMHGLVGVVQAEGEVGNLK